MPGPSLLTLAGPCVVLLPEGMVPALPRPVTVEEGKGDKRVWCIFGCERVSSFCLSMY